MSTLAVVLVVAAACVVVVWAWALWPRTTADEPVERRKGTGRDCPECGETMLDDRGGITGAYVCANGHPAVLFQPHPYTSDGGQP